MSGVFRVLGTSLELPGIDAGEKAIALPIHAAVDPNGLMAGSGNPTWANAP